MNLDTEKIIYLLSGVSFFSSLAAGIFYLKHQIIQKELDGLLRTQKQLREHDIPSRRFKRLDPVDFAREFPLGSLDIILGCNGSGKTRHLEYLYSKYEILDKKKMIFITFSDQAQNLREDLGTYKFVQVDTLETCLRWDSYKNSSFVFIDDLHLWPDQNLIDIVVGQMVHKDKKHVILSTNHNSTRSLQLLPFAEHVHFLEAYCIKCKDGTSASFTSSEGEPVCRFHDDSGRQWVRKE